MVWALALLVALMIPLAAVVLDSPLARAFVERRFGGAEIPADAKELAKRLGVLEAELEEVRGELKQLRESQQFVQHLLENPADRREAPQLPKPTP
jgi:hypothetical protein